MRIEYMYEQLGELIKEHRVKMHLTQSQLAEKVSLSRASIANIESGRQKILFHQVYVFAKCLNVELVDLLPKNEIARKTVYDVMPTDASNKEAEWIKTIMREAQSA